MFATLVALSLALTNPEGQFEKAKKLTLDGHYHESEAILKTIPPNKVDYQAYHFFRLTNNFATNNPAAAQKHAKELEESFSHTLPRRYEMLSHMMIHDLETWKKDDLGDIVRDMRNSSDRLKNGQGGKETQEIQTEIVKKLEKLIKENEDKANGGWRRK